MWKCPSCRLENPETAQRCDCGSDPPTVLQRTANLLARVVTVVGAAVAAILVAVLFAEGFERGVVVSTLVIVELVCLTPFVVAWLGLRFRPGSIPLSVAVGSASGLGLFAYSDVLFRHGGSALGYFIGLVPFVQLGWCLLAIALTWLLGHARGRGKPYEEYSNRGEPPQDAAELRLLVRPDDAYVWIDGEFRGTDRGLARLVLRPGRHQVEVIRPGFRTATREVEVRRGATASLRIELERP